MALDTNPYKGVRDFYPEDQFVQNYLFAVLRDTAESFGYQEYSASILEPAELYKNKTSEEIVNEQTYAFTDRGDREVILRPEMTPTVARMIAAKRQEIAFPLRWYSLPNVFRYERPQKGRLREHWQLNCDIFGVSDIVADVEIIALAAEILRRFGASENDFEIRVSDRRLLSGIFRELDIESATEATVMRLLDRRAKIDNFEEELEALLKEKARDFLDKLSRASSSPELEELLSRLADLGVKNISIDTGIVRGFDYYTGIVFEVFDTSPENNRALFGGGRYDNLLSLFSQDPLPAVGFGMGDVTLRDFLAVHDLLPEVSSQTHLYICTMSEDARRYGNLLAQDLRDEGLNVEVDASNKKIGEQIKFADKKRIQYVICIGEDEMSSDSYTLKRLSDGEEEKVGRADIARIILSA